MFRGSIILSLVVWFGMINLLVAQNLIKNPSFESFSKCPNRTSSFVGLVDDVSLPTSSAADYYNTCSGVDFNVPNNVKGNQDAADGNGYTGLFFYALNDYREYIQLGTTEALKYKQPYRLSFKVSRAETSNLSLKGMSIVFANKKVELPNGVVINPARMSTMGGYQFQEVKLQADNTLAETDEWVTLTAEFMGKGFENYLLVGNFRDNDKTELILKNGIIRNADYSYYYVDDFELIELERTNFENDKIYVLERDPFEPKGYKLDRRAMESVKKIYGYLKDNSDAVMKITGLSTGMETPEYNKFISSLRARAVALYLKELGIDEERIVWEGAGEGKAKKEDNRFTDEAFSDGRVEFVISN